MTRRTVAAALAALLPGALAAALLSQRPRRFSVEIEPADIDAQLFERNDA